MINSQLTIFSVPFIPSPQGGHVATTPLSYFLGQFPPPFVKIPIRKVGWLVWGGGGVATSPPFKKWVATKINKIS